MAAGLSMVVVVMKVPCRVVVIWRIVSKCHARAQTQRASSDCAFSKKVAPIVTPVAKFFQLEQVPYNDSQDRSEERPLFDSTNPANVQFIHSAK
jgi:hypothetical protein